MSTTRDRISKRRNFTTGELVTEEAVDNIGNISSQQMLHLLGELFWDEAGGAPRSGFPGDACAPTNGGSDLEVVIAAGFGLMLDSAETDEFEPHYKPIAVDTADTFSVDAHDPSNPRYDLVSLSPNVISDQSGTATVRDVSTGAISTTTSTRRRRWGYTRTVTKGTPAATPTRPTLPAGNIPVAWVRVPATSGTVLVEDARQILTVGQGFHTGPGAAWSANHVIPSSYARANGTLAVTSTGTLDINIGPGDAVAGGQRVTSSESEVLSATPDGSQDRIALVYINSAGTVAIRHGTPAAIPVTPVVADTECALASILVTAATTTIGPSDITDLREVGTYIATDHIQDDAVTTAKIADDAVGTDQIATGAVTANEIAANTITSTEIATNAVTGSEIDVGTIENGNIANGTIRAVKFNTTPVLPDVAVSTTSPNVRRLTIQVEDWEGQAQSASYRLRVALELDGSPSIGGYDLPSGVPNHDLTVVEGLYTFDVAVSTGTLVTPGTQTGWGGTRSPGSTDHHRHSVVVDTNSSGQAVVDVTDRNSGSNFAVWARVEAVNVPSSPALVALQY